MKIRRRQRPGAAIDGGGDGKKAAHTGTAQERQSGWLQWHQPGHAPVKVFSHLRTQGMVIETR